MWSARAQSNMKENGPNQVIEAKESSTSMKIGYLNKEETKTNWQVMNSSCGKLVYTAFVNNPTWPMFFNSVKR